MEDRGEEVSPAHSTLFQERPSERIPRLDLTPKVSKNWFPYFHWHENYLQPNKRPVSLRSLDNSGSGTLPTYISGKLAIQPTQHNCSCICIIGMLPLLIRRKHKDDSKIEVTLEPGSKWCFFRWLQALQRVCKLLMSFWPPRARAMIWSMLRLVLG